MKPVIRPFQAEDVAAIRDVHLAAFGERRAEATLVVRLHAAGAAVVSLVAMANEIVIGHVLFSPAGLQFASSGICPPIVGLGPIGVIPAFQRHGVGSALISAGLLACADAGWQVAVVLGDPRFYRRFGFERAGERGLLNEYGADDAFRVLELAPGGLRGVAGVVTYRPEFGDLDE